LSREDLVDFACNVVLVIYLGDDLLVALGCNPLPRRTGVKFWVGSNDVGPHAYSGLTNIDAPDIDAAKRLAELMFDKLPVDPRREDTTLRLAVVPRRELKHIGSDPGGLRPDRKYVVEIKR
jgi:hypothetical protein